MALPSESAVTDQLRSRGVPEHVVRGGSKGLIAAWRTFVQQVEDGYTLGLDDYRNDLDIRELISVTRLDSEVVAEDQRLREALTKARRPIWESDAPDAFWILGYPENAEGELLADLLAEGLVSGN